MQQKASGVGFDWPEKSGVWQKVKEEIQEFETEVGNMDADKAEAEFGDLLFSLVNAARHYKINPDNALERTNMKFSKRFNFVENQAKLQGKQLKDMTLEEMDELWELAKLQK
jgi:XTP/dITP diphosphohydrolase